MYFSGPRPRRQMKTMQMHPKRLLHSSRKLHSHTCNIKCGFWKPCTTQRNLTILSLDQTRKRDPKFCNIPKKWQDKNNSELCRKHCSCGSAHKPPSEGNVRSLSTRGSGPPWTGPHSTPTPGRQHRKIGKTKNGNSVFSVSDICIVDEF